MLIIKKKSRLPSRYGYSDFILFVQHEPASSPIHPCILLSWPVCRSLQRHCCESSIISYCSPSRLFYCIIVSGYCQGEKELFLKKTVKFMGGEAVAAIGCAKHDWLLLKACSASENLSNGNHHCGKSRSYGISRHCQQSVEIFLRSLAVVGTVRPRQSDASFGGSEHFCSPSFPWPKSTPEA